MPRDLKNRRVLVVGLGKSGLAAARLLAREGAQLSIADEKTDAGAAGEELRAIEERHRRLCSELGVALPEEIVKILVIFAVSSRRRHFSDPMDTVVYGAAAGLGFAAYENLAYLVQHAEMWRALAALRSVLTVPFHGALGIIAGAYLAIARSGTALGAQPLGQAHGVGAA